jgi:orotate phosphoribosyltransferase
MENTLLSMIDVRRGHFRFESGHHGDLWLDLDSLFRRPVRLRPAVELLTRRIADHEVPLGDGTADASGGAGHQRGLAGQVSHLWPSRASRCSL